MLAIPVQRLQKEAEEVRKHLQLGQYYVAGRWWKVRWWEKETGLDGQVRKVRRHAIVGPATGPERLSKKEAQRLGWNNIMRFVNASATGPSTAAMTVRQYVEKFFLPNYVYSGALKPAGIHHYEYSLGKLLDKFGDWMLKDLKKDPIQTFIRELGQKHAPQTVTHVRNVFKTVIDQAAGDGFFVGDNPVKKVRLPKPAHKERTALTWDQAAEAVEQLRTPIKEMVLFALLTSLNVAEICGLQWKHINLSDEWINGLPPWSFTVERQYYRGHFGTTKTRSRARKQPVPAVLIPLLQEWKKVTKFCEPEDTVFCSSTGNPIIAENVNKREFRRLSKKLGVRVTWHVFRHTCATLAEEAGMLESDRVALLGHSNVLMTHHYTHSNLERRREVIDRMAERIVRVEGEANALP
jgi:Site-specific recombinase XerC